MFRRLDLRGVTDLRTGLPRPAAAGAPLAVVREVLAEVRGGGDAAVRACTERFDGVRVEELRVPPGRAEAALGGLATSLRAALEEARANIAAFSEGQVPADRRHERGGVVVRELVRPVDRAGVYVPRSEAPLMSTVLMTAVPARVAGVGEIVLCSAPGRDGEVAEGILAAAALAGVDEVYRIGGAQAVAAMAYGTESVRPVDVIVGPGGVVVAQAKREVAGVVGVPSSFSGPSEVVVVADETAPVEAAAIDLIVQVEHGPDSVAWLVSWSEPVIEAVVARVAELAAAAPRRGVIEANLRENSWAALVEGPEQAIALANAIAPEHLELMVADPEALVGRVRHAGAVFCGPDAPASVGDYVAGPSHVLPTYGSARFAGALRVDDFLKRVNVVSLDAATLGRLAPHVVAIAEAEGLDAHARSVLARGAR